MAIDASLIEADANKQNSTPGEEWDVESIDPKDAPRAVREYFDTLGEAAFGAASEVQPKFTSHSDPESQWTAARKGPASFSYSDNYLIDTGQGHTINKTGRGRFEQDDAEANEGTWTRADFEWDAENDQYICPEGHALKQFRRNYSDPNRGPTSEGTARYRAIKEVCQISPSKAKCCPNADARKITREETEDAGQVARDIAKTKQYAISMKLRKKVERLFAHLKRILGLGRLRLRGPCGANDEFLLAPTAQNLRKLAKIFPAPQQAAKA